MVSIVGADLSQLVGDRGKVLDALQELRERQLARLGGRPEPIANSWELINQLRDERARYLSGEDDE